jgi:hypothetical protein
MKITKSKLAQIVQEELQAVTAEGYKAYKRDDMSPHAKDMAKNKKKGYSAQAAVTAIPDNEKVDKAYYDSLNKKPKRGLEEAGDDSDTLDAYMLGREHAVEVWRGEREDSDIMMMSNAAYRAGFEDATEEIAAEEGDDSLHRDSEHDYEDDNYEEEYDDDGMWENKITKSKLAQIIKEELKAVLSESDVDPVEAGQDEDIQEMIYQQIADNLQDGPLPADSIFSLTEPEYESPYEHLADQWEDILAAALHEMSEGADATIEKSHDTMTGEPYYSPIGFLS